MTEIVTMPKLGFDMAEGTLVRWLISEGENVGKGSVLAEIETDKATVEVESNFSGVLLRQLINAGEIVPINTPIAIVGKEGETVEVPAEEKMPVIRKPVVADNLPTKGEKVVEEEANTEEGNLPAGVRASPIARHMSEKYKIDLRRINGSGPQGRIVKEDIERYLDKQKEHLVKDKPVLPDQIMIAGEDKRIPLTRLRTIIGKRMVDATRSVPHFFVTHEYDVAALMEIRSRMNAIFTTEEKLSVNDFIIRGVALTLMKFPNLNATLDEQKGEVIHHGRVNIGVAVALDSGLLTVVCQDANQKTIRQISMDVSAKVMRAREGKVKTEDIEGSTFTVSNLGMWDVEQFTAIINPPEAAILAVGAVRKIPVISNDELTHGLRMKATISVDHRISDGAEAAKFLQELASYLEEPLRLIL